MAKVITFSRFFPAYHPKKGQPTFFVEKLWNSLHRQQKNIFTNYYSIIEQNPGNEKAAELFWDSIIMNYDNIGNKHHTIRKGHRWKAGDLFSPRVWSGKPYKSPMIKIAPDVMITKVYYVNIFDYNLFVNGNLFDFKTLANNDGLKQEDLEQWFGQNFEGQIICWNEAINYNGK